MGGKIVYYLLAGQLCVISLTQNQNEYNKLSSIVALSERINLRYLFLQDFRL